MTAAKPLPPTLPHSRPGTASDAIAALKTDTGAFLTAHMAAAGGAPVGDDINMLEEEVSAGEEDEPDGRPTGKRKRGKGA